MCLPQSWAGGSGHSDCGVSPGVLGSPVGGGVSMNSLGPQGCVTDSVSPAAEWEHSLPGGAESVLGSSWGQ